MCTTATRFIESDHPEVLDFSRERVEGAESVVERAVALFYAVRDGIVYDAREFSLSPEGLRAGRTLERGRSWCVPKAVLLAACCRAVGIPARLGFADIRNRLAGERLRKLMGTDVFAWHGYTLIRIDGRWLKATPAFDVELCRRHDFKPVEFDGRDDAVYHPTDLNGTPHMEYLKYHGEYDDVPVEEISESLPKYYPALTGVSYRQIGEDQ
jgi:transglutaminase-like putative cysteine protease